jgi:hypothetical protein
VDWNELMIVLNQFQGTEINLTFQHGMRDFILNGKAARIVGKQASVVIVTNSRIKY